MAEINQDYSEISEIPKGPVANPSPSHERLPVEPLTSLTPRSPSAPLCALPSSPQALAAPLTLSTCNERLAAVVFNSVPYGLHRRLLPHRAGSALVCLSRNRKNSRGAGSRSAKHQGCARDLQPAEGPQGWHTGEQAARGPVGTPGRHPGLLSTLGLHPTGEDGERRARQCFPRLPMRCQQLVSN